MIGSSNHILTMVTLTIPKEDTDPKGNLTVPLFWPKDFAPPELQAAGFTA